MPRFTIFSQMGFRPDPKFARSALMKSKKPFYNRVTHPHISAKQRYAELNFPVDKASKTEMRDGENPNLLDSVRQMAMTAQTGAGWTNFSRQSRLSVPSP